MPKDIAFVDPYFEQEKKKYDNPIPSRQSILDYFERVGKALSFKQLVTVIGMEDEASQDALSYRLRAMVRDGQLLQDKRMRYGLVKRLNLIKGKVVAHSDGFGFVIPEQGGDDFFLSAREMQQLMHGDRVLAYQLGVDRRGRKEGRVHQILERYHQTVVGKFFCERGVSFVEPDNRRLTQPIAIANEDVGDAKTNQMVLVEILAYPTKRHPALGRVIRVLGEHLAPGLEIEVALHAHQIPFEWPQAVMDEVGSLPTAVSEQDLKGRKDLRALPFVTIDGESAKDFDDAVYCRAKEGDKGWQLFVAIADVSHYVLPGSAIDFEATHRATSVYFPERVIPMLPEQLSNGICSLNPHVDRLCLVCEMHIDASGQIRRSQFYPSVIHSHARLTYTTVGEWLETPESATAELAEGIFNLRDVYHALAHQRRHRGAIDFETTETQIVFDENRKIADVVPLHRNDAHRLIEECMLAANVCAARLVTREKMPALYRVHEPPNEDKRHRLREFLAGFGLTLGGGKKPHPKDYATLMQDIALRPEKSLIETVMLRSMSQARYMEKNAGHFGLAYAAYAHFTSPIRRYPDLLMHRAIRHTFDGKSVTDFPYTHEVMADVGKHASTSERRADEATRDVVNWLKCEYMLDKVGQIFSGKISAVTGFGLFVMLDDIYVEGLIHMTSLSDDAFRFDAVRHRYMGERTGKQYRLGDALSVMVARVDLDERKIDFELHDGTEKQS